MTLQYVVLYKGRTSQKKATSLFLSSFQRLHTVTLRNAEAVENAKFYKNTQLFIGQFISSSASKNLSIKVWS